MTHTAITSILDLVDNAIIIKWIQSGNIYLMSKQNHLCGIFQDGKWKLPTGEFSINYYGYESSFEVIAESK